MTYPVSGSVLTVIKSNAAYETVRETINEIWHYVIRAVRSFREKDASRLLSM